MTRGGGDSRQEVVALPTQRTRGVRQEAMEQQNSEAAWSQKAARLQEAVSLQEAARLLEVVRLQEMAGLREATYATRGGKAMRIG